jgi:excisionase family DNA binding protein
MLTPIAYSIYEAVAVSGTSRTALYKALQARELRAHKRGTRTLILADELHRWIKNLPEYKPIAGKESSHQSNLGPKGAL